MNRFNGRHKSIPVKVIDTTTGQTYRFSSLKLLADYLDLSYASFKKRFENKPDRVNISPYLIIPNYKVKSIKKTPVIVTDIINGQKRSFGSQYAAGKFLDTAQSNINYAIRSGKAVKSRFKVSQTGVKPITHLSNRKGYSRPVCLVKANHQIKFDSIKEAAAFLGVGSNTIRVHLKSKKALKGYLVADTEINYYKADFNNRTYSANTIKQLADKLGLSVQQVNYAYYQKQPINGLKVELLR